VIPFRIDQVASNLVVNAIRYGEGKPVHVSVHAVNGAARIIVRDALSESNVGCGP